MQIIYFIILILAIAMEIGSYNTDNFLKKISILLVILGSLAHLAGKTQPLIEIGVALYFVVELCGSAFHNNYDRRHKG
ncbi:MAG: hypothetical protein V4440_14790 [Pseudomonadota bacterium]